VAEIAVAAFQPRGNRYRTVQILGSNGRALMQPFSPFRLTVDLRMQRAPTRPVSKHCSQPRLPVRASRPILSRWRASYGKALSAAIPPSTILKYSKLYLELATSFGNKGNHERAHGLLELGVGCWTAPSWCRAANPVSADGEDRPKIGRAAMLSRISCGG